MLVKVACCKQCNILPTTTTTKKRFSDIGIEKNRGNDHFFKCLSKLIEIIVKSGGNTDIFFTKNGVPD